MALGKRYDFSEAEPRIQATWKEQDIYAPATQGAVFSIDTPPPTMSGRMHLGHAFSYAQGDFIARYKRMRGFSVLYPWGTDDNGLPTERLVEREKTVRSTRMERGEFVKLVLDYLEEESGSFTQDWRMLGISADFEHAYSTIDAHCQKTSQASFLDLHEKGLVFRKKTPVSWCVTCQTAIAQAEFENVEKKSAFHDIAFDGPTGELVVSTTRPELLIACVALAAHPDDKRYKGLDGKKALVPLFDYEVPIILDEDADPELGTGLMMVCTFGDKEDVQKWYKHDLPLRELFTPDGRLTALAGEFEGMRILQARETIVQALEQKGLLKSSRSIMHAANVHERCHTPIEFLHTEQWFVNVLGFKDELLKLGEQITWYPSFMHQRYKHWVENLNWDWCISRQRHFGVPFPVWYHKKTGEVITASLEELPIDPTKDVPKAWKAKAKELEPETDVLDTWATSSVTPQIVLDWPGSKHFDKQFPMGVRLQAHDIIRTWAFYTIVKSLHHHGKPPWKEIVISGHALDPKGKKMGKSKGNAVDPHAMMEKYGADALRYWAASTKLGEDLPFQEKDLVTGVKTAKKLWNASRFATMHLDEYEGTIPDKLELLDRWILAEFARVLEQSTKRFDEYEYSHTKLAIDNFFWNVFCDYYLELVKDRLYNEERGKAAKHSAQYTLYTVLLGILKVFAPIMPHITEDIYLHFFSEREEHPSIHVSPWPEPREEWVDDGALRTGRVVCELLAQVRKHKSEQQLSLGAELVQASIAIPKDLKAGFEAAAVDFAATARLKGYALEEAEEPKVTIEK